MMENTLIPELDQLYSDVLGFKSTKSYRGLLDFVVKFPHIAPYNAILLYLQYPGCRYALSANEWRWKFNRTVKPGSTPLIILRTFGPVSFVFDIGSTEGEDVPESILNPLKASGYVTEGMMEQLVRNLTREGIRFSMVDHAGGNGGLIAFGAIPETIIRLGTKNGKSVRIRTLFEIVVNSNSNLPSRYATILHELGHFYCGHCPHPKANWLPIREELSLGQVEFEAESVSWLLCQRLGIVGPSVRYLHGYLEHEHTIPVISVDAVLKAVGKIERLLRSDIKPRKELLIEDE